MRTVITPQNIPGMAIAVQSDSAYDARPFVALRHALERIVDDGLVGGLEVSWDEVVIEHEVRRIGAETRNVDRLLRQTASGARRRACVRGNVQSSVMCPPDRAPAHGRPASETARSGIHRAHAMCAPLVVTIGAMTGISPRR